jgi:hypothetical protein
MSSLGHKRAQYQGLARSNILGSKIERRLRHYERRTNMLQKRWIRWGLVEVAVVAGIVSCGEVSESPDADDADDTDDADADAGTGGRSTGGATGSGGAVTSGGAISVGGSIFIGSGGRVQAQGGATSDWCPGIPAGVVVPP